MSLVAELKRRNVFRVALFYIVAAWLIIQVAETVLPVFGVPDLFLRGIIVVLAIGFVPALVFSWAFELTPDGLKREKDVEVEPATKQRTASRLNWATLIAAVLAISVIVADRMLPAPATTPSPSTETAAAQADGPAPLVDQPDGASIAVLPFLNMSPDADNAYFADGISEELLNILAGIDGLKVASRTSAFSFRGSERPIPEIAGALGVRYVLEGSVRKQGERVRITSQLIDADSDAHLWSESYERELTDIFRVQENIARAITGELKGLLVAAPVTVDAPTDNLQAYQHFLRGRSLFYQRVSLDTAIAELRRAVELDPEFAQAWAFLAAAEWVVGRGGYATDMSRKDVLRRAHETLDRALALDESIPIAKALKGVLLLESGTGEAIDQGLRLLEEAAAVPSPDTTSSMWYALNLVELGKIERAFDLLEQAYAADPVLAINTGYLGIAHAMLGRREEGARYALRAVELTGALTYWAILVAIDASHAGDIDEAVDLLSEAQSLLNDNAPDVHFLEIATALENEIRYSEWIENNPPGTTAFADLTTVMSAILLRDNEAALEHALKSERNSRQVLIYAAWMPALVELREHPKFFEMTAELGLVDYWQTHGFPLGCRPVDGPDDRHLDCPEFPR